MSTTTGRSNRALSAMLIALMIATPLLAASNAQASPGNGWATPQLVDSGGGYAGYMDSCADRLGNVMVVFREWGAGGYQLWARRFVSSSGWQAPVQVTDASTDYVFDLSVGCSPVGDAFTTWRYWNDTAYQVASARYIANWGWEAPWTAGNFSGSPSEGYYLPKAAIDGYGNGYGFWNWWNGSAYHLVGFWMASNGTAFPAVQLDNTTISTDITVASSGAMGVVVSFRQREPGSASFFDFVSVRHNGYAWGQLQFIEHTTGDVYRGFVAMDDRGLTFAAWTQIWPSQYSWYSTQWSGGPWSAPQYMLTSEFVAGLGASPMGVAVVLTIGWTGSYNTLTARRIGDDGVLMGAVSLGTRFDWYYDPSITVDTSGTAFVGYNSWDGSAYVGRFARFGGPYWADDTRVDRDGSTRNVAFIKAFPLGDGRVLGVWREAAGGGVYNAEANIFTGRDWTPPYIRIATPLNGATSATSSAAVYGITEPGATVQVSRYFWRDVWHLDEHAASVGTDGHFVGTVTLEEGANWIYVAARDAAGNWNYYSYNIVYYSDPQKLLDLERLQAGRTGWHDAAPVDQVSYSGAWWPRIVTDSYGNAFAAWYENVYGQDKLYVARYTPGYGWTTPRLMQAEPGYLLNAYFQLAVSPLGSFVIVWTTVPVTGGYNHVWSAHYSFNFGWTGPYRLDVGERYADRADVAVAPNGTHYTMVWQERDENDYNASLGGFRYHIWTRMYNVSNNQYSPAERVENFTRQSLDPEIAIDGAGRKYVTYRTHNGAQYNIAVSRNNGTGWDNGTVIESTPAFNGGLETSVDSAGNLTVAWRTYASSIYNYYAGRLFYGNNTWSGGQLIWANGWSWDPEVLAHNSGRAFVAFTATVGTAGAFAAVAPPGGMFGTPALLDNSSGNQAGGPKLSLGTGGSPVRVHFDEYEGAWRGQMREYNMSSLSWGPVRRVSPDDKAAHIPDVAPMPDGGFIALYAEENYTLGMNQIVARRWVPLDTTPPAIAITSPVSPPTWSVPFIQVRGTAELGARVFVQNVEVTVAANGTWSTTVPLVNGSNPITATARDAVGNEASAVVVVTFDDPDRRRIEQLEAERAALSAQLNATNASLTAALAAQNSALLSEIANLNTSLVTQLAAQNTALLDQIADLNASLLADLAALDADLTRLIADTNTSLLAELAAQNSDLMAEIAQTNASLLAQMAAGDANLAQLIAQTNASLLAEMAANDAELRAALAETNTSLLAALALLNDDLLQVIADTNSTLLAELAAGDAALRAELAATNADLLAALALQNDDLLQVIATTNATLLAELAAGDAALFARLTADDSALWEELNATAAEQQAEISGTQSGLSQTNSSLSSTQDELGTTTQAAASANTMALMGVLLGGVGLALGAMAFMLARKRPPLSEPSGVRMAPPTPGGSEEVAAEVVSNRGHARGSSMAAESELAGYSDNEP